MTSHSPRLHSSTFRTNYGKFVMSAYVPDTDMAITATSRGYIVVWEKSRWTKKGETIEAQFSSRLVFESAHSCLLHIREFYAGIKTQGPLALSSCTKTKASRYCGQQY